MKKPTITRPGQKRLSTTNEIVVLGGREWIISDFSRRFPSVTTAVKFLNRHSLILGIGLMLLLTWPIDLANAGVLPFSLPFAVYILVGYGFVIASILITWLTQEKKALLPL